MIGRIEEQKLLQDLLTEEESQFVAVFGRRRIGKTYLIRESFKHSFTFQHTGLSNNAIPRSKQKQAQLDKFAEALVEYGYQCSQKLTSWEEAFNGLKEIIKASKEEKKVIFIDELSWMDTRDCGLISALEGFWNGWVCARKEKDVVLIICASATYWMINNVVNARGGLHNRLTASIYLKPFTLKECSDYLDYKRIVFSKHQILQCYMIMGGVPYYWSLLKRGKSLAQNIDELFFKEGSILQQEYDNLYRALFNSPEQYIAIVEALSTVNKGITRDEIIKKTGIAGSGNLTRKLSELGNCGFIRKYVPYGYTHKNCLYQLVDNFTLFYYKFLKNRPSDECYWSNKIDAPQIRAWSGIAFERVCLEHIPQIKAALGIAGVYTEASTWYCLPNPDEGIHGSQIDLLIVRRDQIINLCEMKYSETGFIVDAAFDRDQRRRISDFKQKSNTKYAIHSTLVTTYPVEENAYTNDIQAVITSDELFR